MRKDTREKTMQSVYFIFITSLFRMKLIGLIDILSPQALIIYLSRIRLFGLHNSSAEKSNVQDWPLRLLTAYARLVQNLSNLSTLPNGLLRHIAIFCLKSHHWNVCETMSVSFQLAFTYANTFRAVIAKMKRTVMS